MNGVLETLKRLGPQKLLALGAVTLALMAFFAFIIMRVTAPAMTTLFTDLTVQDSAAVMKELEQRGVKYETRYEGATLMVPKDQALRLRMDLAAKGMPQGGGIGYEIFDKTDSLSATSFVQNVNQLRALEGELARTIRALERVQNARVHLALPEKQLFQREKKEARASIVLKVRGELDPGQVRAIRHLVASAVEGLKPDRISIVDEAGRLLADGAGDANDIAAIATEKQQGFENRLRRQVEEIVASVVGKGRTRVQVAAEMDFNRIQQTQESFDPESRVVRSTQTRNENNLSNDAREGQVTVNNELPGANAQNGQNNAREASQKNEETVNYEISKTVRTEVIEGGRVKRLSVAVLVDGNYARTGNAVEYQPRPQEDLDRINALVRSSIGFDQRRGDLIEVVNLRFAEAPEVNEIREQTFMEKLFSFSKDDTFRIIELLILAAVSAFVFLFVIRPLMSTIKGPEKPQQTVMVQAANGQMIAVPAPPPPVNPADNEPPTATEQMIEMSQISGAIQARSIEKVGEVASKAPQETVAILRQWVHGT